MPLWIGGAPSICLFHLCHGPALGTVPGTFFSTTSAEVPSESYCYQKVTCKLLITDWPENIVTACVIELAARDTTDPLDLNQHSQWRIECNCFEWAHLSFNNQKHFCFVVCWGSTDCPLVNSRGADPARAWWSDAEFKSFSGVTAVEAAQL